MHQVTRRSVIALAIFACALASCGGDDSTAHVTTSYFAPDSLGEVARVSAFVIEGRVISDPTVHDVPPENVPPPDAAGENSPSPAVFAYEVVNVSVTRVFGRPGTPAAPSVGETIVVGVPVQGEAAPDTLSEDDPREEHTSELQSLMRISYAVFCLKKKRQ